MKWVFSAAFLLLAAPGSAGVEDDARRVLAAKCLACHGQAAMGGLRLDSAAGLRKGGKSGKPATEMLLRAVRGGGDGVKAMPPGGALQADELAALAAWVAAGAVLPDAGSEHWSWQELKPVANGVSVDSIVAKSLAAKGLVGNAAADRRTLIRRLYFDLVGLPPTEQQFARAFGDRRPDWAARLVDELLASPHYGEQWGRHWLDIARYGEDDFSGTEKKPYPNAWRYRDWVVQAVNRNLPYDRFLKAQIAGDLLGDPGGTGLMGLGPWYYGISQPPQARADERHDRVDVVSRGMLGVTLACARCHDHKYDPLSQKDYYALSGVFASSKYQEYPLVSAAVAEAWKAQKKQLDGAEKELKDFLDRQADGLREVYGRVMSRYLLATLGGSIAGLDEELVKRWTAYLKKPDEFHPFLKAWFAAPNAASAQEFESRMLAILFEKRKLDEENRVLVEEAMKVAPKPKRTIVLPFGYRSDEDFNPGADVPSKSLDRDRYVAFNRVFLETAAPLRFAPEMTARLLPASARAEHERLKRLRDERKAALPAQYGYVDGTAEFEPIDLPLDVRGNPTDPGDLVPRRFPLVLSGGKELPLRKGSGRLELAEAVVKHPLAARVAVNRIWMHLFGEGIVRTPSNFGLVGDRPGNPELLEYLAGRFVALRMDQKAMIREIVLSEVYQRNSDRNAAAEKLDGENRLWWRQNRKRLAAEPLRDALLAASGHLDRQVGGESAELSPAFARRTLYAKVGRFQAEETLSLFDLPSASVTCEQRVVTNVPLQKLFFLNSEIVARESEGLGLLLEKRGLDRGYQRVFQRAPSASEMRAAKEFRKSGGSWKQFAQVLLSTNEFAYVD
ncbi:PSD1 and planctomycete cytochrome C domain-containing protein [Bryobacter aggregatus]|uniref:PSD1 and planctomycete cytochrome C domain-containing protein n=1 Tax=Bryobacter aggregatus TaxID=360054 RepID=UPI0004E111EA|nr:PSD1 and planctomycete cytochrome C domain-containing protein [Bryobacter aggregatus]